MSPVVAYTLTSALQYLLETGLLKPNGRGANSMVGSGGCVDEVEELVRGLWACLLHHGHRAEGKRGDWGI